MKLYRQTRLAGEQGYLAFTSDMRSDCHAEGSDQIQQESIEHSKLASMAIIYTEASLPATHVMDLQLTVGKVGIRCPPFFPHLGGSTVSG
jgi:hypothetical protein